MYVTSSIFVPLELGTKSHGLTTLITTIPFQANSFRFMGSHMRISVTFIFVFVTTARTMVPIVTMSTNVAIKIAFIFKTSATTVLFTHVVRTCLVNNLMLIESTAKGEALAASFTDKGYICLSRAV